MFRVLEHCKAPWTINGRWRYINVYLFIYLFIYMREQDPGANLLHESISEASSLVCTEIYLP